MQGITKRWKTPPASDPALSIVDRILNARGLERGPFRDAFLNPSLNELEDPDDIDGATQAGALLCDALKKERRVLIFGDYDADGITATTVLYHVIASATGKTGPPIYIPDRMDEGYGIRPESIDKFADDGIDLVITVDCGITAIEAAHRAKERGITLIITDHHKPLESGELPDCAAIVHPSLEGNPSTPFAGVGVAYQVAWAFARAWSGSRQVDEQLKKALLEMVPLVAIGTIADMVPLTGGNRILARWGLQLLPVTNNVGLLAIMKQLDTPKKKLNSSHVSFGIAPLLNAVGRLAHAEIAVDLLTHLEGDLAEAAAGELADLNRKRQGVQRKIVDDALKRIESLDDHRIVILQDDSWQRGVVGVAAGKCIEQHYKPTILLSGEGEQLVGSARSIQGFSIFDALSACQDFLVQYGGHDMAAGLTIDRKNFEPFVAGMNAYANEHITDDQLIPTITPDITADLQEITHTAAVEIEKIGPFGMGNKTPVVQLMGVKLDDVSQMGVKGMHLSLKLGNSRHRVRCVWWGHGKIARRLSRGMLIDVVGRIKVNEFRGIQSAELDVIDIALPSV